MTLNELDDNDAVTRLPPTDCRFRPDVRMMENGDIGIQRLRALIISLHSHSSGVSGLNCWGVSVCVRYCFCSRNTVSKVRFTAEKLK